MPINSITDARRILPKELLTKLQRHCTGLVYMPPLKNTRRDTVLRLHKDGISVAEIARRTSFSTKWVRHILTNARSSKSSRPASKLYRLMPNDLLEQVQKYAVGHLYIPPRKTKKAGRKRRVEKLFNEGLPVIEIARRMKLSRRHVYRLKRVWLEDSCRREIGGTPGQGRHETVDEPFLPRVTLKKCPGCGRPVVERGATYCDICKNIEGDVDGNVVVLSNCPIVAF